MNMRQLPSRWLQLMLVALIAQCLAGVSRPANAQMNVPVYGQKWSPWFNDQLGFNVPTSKIGNDGCAVTSCAMVRQYFSGSAVTPRDMNNWLKGNNGFYNNLIIFSAVHGFAGSRDYTRTAADLNYINSLLDHGYLLVVMTYFPPARTSTHFVVLKGHSGNTYYMNDPWYGDGNVTFNARYGDPGRWIYGINIFQH